VGGAPVSLPAVAAAGLVDDEAIGGELAQVVAGRAARFADPRGELRRGGRAVLDQLGAQPHPQRVGEAAQHAGLQDQVRGRVKTRKAPIARCGHGGTLHHKDNYAKICLRLRLAAPCSPPRHRGTINWAG
jgi:hypothetical protein